MCHSEVIICTAFVENKSATILSQEQVRQLLFTHELQLIPTKGSQAVFSIALCVTIYNLFYDEYLLKL